MIIDAAGRSVTVEAVNPDYFMNLKIGAFFEFDPAKGVLKIKESDNVYNLKKSQ